MRTLLFAAAMAMISQNAQAELTRNLVDTCFETLRDAQYATFKMIAKNIRSQKRSADIMLQSDAKMCLELGQELLETRPEQDVATLRVNDALSNAQPNYEGLLEQVEENFDFIHEILQFVDRLPEQNQLDEEATEKFETVIYAWVKPLPAKRISDNLQGYKALAKLRPDNITYASKVSHYADALEGNINRREAQARSTLNSLRKHVVEFDQSAWYRHPKSPRYQDTRSYITLYILEDANGKKDLEFFVNYTGWKWLFVYGAKVNIDGEIFDFGSRGFHRDNDTEVWEWYGYRMTPELHRIVEKISISNRAVVRFSGRNGVKDLVVSSSDKRVMSQMLDVWALLESQNALGN